MYDFLDQLRLSQTDLDRYTIDLNKGDVLFHEGEQLKDLYFILAGKVRLFKQQLHSGKELVVDTLSKGKVVGIMAFATSHPSLTTSKVVKSGHAIRIPRDDFDGFLETHPNIYRAIMNILTQDLGERYRHTLFCQLDVDAAYERINEEKEELRQAYKKLEEAQQKLVHKEKMATLGQLTAGFAHEVNNPATALIRSTEVLINRLPAQIAKNENLNGPFFFETGYRSDVISTERIRARVKELEKSFSFLTRTEQRHLAQMNDQAIEALSSMNEIEVRQCIDFFETGKLLRNIDLAGTRITSLVKSMKNYARQDKKEYELIDIRQGIKDTLHVLANRTKFYVVHIEMPTEAMVTARAGELNQVWTNLIVNACDAMGKDGELSINVDIEGDLVVARVIDNGPGIPKEISEKIFEPNFSTKDTDTTKFGLGLGLSISADIIKKYGGKLYFDSRKPHGTEFIVELPHTR